MSHSRCIWIAEQCYGIADAVAFIHDPGVLDPSSAGVYGRHGDIKPENVLWFKKRQNSGRMGALVLSDLGLADTHRVQSRSNIPGHAIPTTPNYRPPECDMAGDKGHISRSFDIWTLGCLFLEFLVWALRGWEGRQNFRFDRCKSAYLNGETDVYFDIRRSEGDIPLAGAEFFFEVKEQVTKVCQQGVLLLFLDNISVSVGFLTYNVLYNSAFKVYIVTPTAQGSSMTSLT